MGIFSFDKKGRLGIDIGTAAIKIVELRQESNRFALANYGILELEAGEGAISVAGQTGRNKIAQLSNQDVVQGIKRLIVEANIQSRDVIASIPSFPTFSTTIAMPYVSEEEVARAIPFEARKYIPVPLSEVQLDWAVVNVKKETKQPSVEVFLVAVPKEEVARYQTIMKDAGLNLRALELESFAVIRALIGNDLSPITVVSIGGRSTSILIVENGFQRASHDYEVGGFAITQSIARAMNVDVQKAEELKRGIGVDNSNRGAITRAMNSVVDMMAFETNKTIHNYEDQRNTKITKILLVGGLANMSGLLEYFSQKLGRPVFFGNALARVITPARIESLRTELNATFVVSIGLAMRKI